MNRGVRFASSAAIAVILSVVSVHYLEESLLPLVEKVRTVIYGDQSYASALSGCENLELNEDWVHPATLALTVYGDAQAILNDAFGPHGPEVLPDYAKSLRGESELRCVAEFLIAVGPRERWQGEYVRALRFNIPHAKYNLDSGWVSGLAQGVVGQVFLAYYLSSGDQRYLAAAQEVARLLDVQIDAGGVRVDLPNGGIWFEEYAQSGARPPLVLNGHLLALDFLYWMDQIEADSNWGELFDSGVQAAVDEIDSYLGFSWSFYDQESNLATRKYHSFHIRQLDRYAMHDPTGALADAGKKMRLQLLLPVGVFQRLFTEPSRLLLFLIGLLFLVYFPLIWWTNKNRWLTPAAETGQKAPDAKS